MKTEHSSLRAGDIIGDTERRVVLCHKLSDADPGSTYESWIAICHEDGAYHPYVVWNVAIRPQGHYASNGDYCSTIKEAIQKYEERGGR